MALTHLDAEYKSSEKCVKAFRASGSERLTSLCHLLRSPASPARQVRSDWGVHRADARGTCACCHWHVSHVLLAPVALACAYNKVDYTCGSAIDLPSMVCHVMPLPVHHSSQSWRTSTVDRCDQIIEGITFAPASNIWEGLKRSSPFVVLLRSCQIATPFAWPFASGMAGCMT